MYLKKNETMLCGSGKVFSFRKPSINDAWIMHKIGLAAFLDSEFEIFAAGSHITYMAFWDL